MSNDDSIDPVLSCFQRNQITKAKKDGNLKSVIAMGDCVILLMLIQMKLKDFNEQIDEENPGRFRGTAQLEQDMRLVLGPDARIHVTEWGGSHIRGGKFRSDEKRGNKKHLIEMIRILNSYEGTPDELQEIYRECIIAHTAFFDSFSIVKSFQKEDTFQSHILKLLSSPSLGRVQQGLVFSALRYRYGSRKNVVTKKTFAGDLQSSAGGTLAAGDIQIWEKQRLAIAIEVKDAVVNKQVWERVRRTHGEYEYALFLLCKSLTPKIQAEINSYANTFAIHLIDYFLTIIFETAVDKAEDPRKSIRNIIEIYNNEFCMKIERDHKICIEISD